METLSARNQLKGTVMDVKKGNIMAEIVLKLRSGDELVSVITAESAKRLSLKKGDEVVAVIKSTEVMIGRP